MKQVTDDTSYVIRKVVATASLRAESCDVAVQHSRCPVEERASQQHPRRRYPLVRRRLLIDAPTASTPAIITTNQLNQ